MYIRDLRDYGYMTIEDLKIGETFEYESSVYMVARSMSIKRASDVERDNRCEVVNLNTGRIREMYTYTKIRKVWCKVDMYDINDEVIDDVTGEVIHVPEKYEFNPTFED